ncbi:MAG: OmpA family protein [Myxococcota bacterium]
MKSFQALVLSLVATVTLVGHGAARAQDPDEWSVQKFLPAMHSLGGFTTEAARVSHELTINAYLMAQYATGIGEGGGLLQDKDGKDVVKSLGTFDLLASVGFLDHLSFALDLPLQTLASGTSLKGEDLSVFNMGDVRLSLKGTIMEPMRLGPGIGLQLDLILPTGGNGQFTHEWDVVVVPKIVLDAITKHVHLMSNMWLHLRSGGFDATQQAAIAGDHIQFAPNLKIDSEMGFSTAAAIFLGSTDFRMIVEGRFESVLSRFFEPEDTRLEFTWGLHWRSPEGLAVGGGVSFAVLNGYGDPDIRPFLTFGYQPVKLIPMPVANTDKDGDGILDRADQCPNDPEDMDGFKDEDGCPEADNDMDGIPDAVDGCPDEAEDMDGDRDTDGCPDGDGDHDGIADDIDKCPTQPEDVDGFQDEDGCPDPDNDQDGLPDKVDKCPNDPEDKDGWKDDDGCPEPDNDSDGILDVNDKCPDKAEDKDGCQDEDGCPEEGRVCVSKEKITITEKIFFKTGKADILPKSYSLLAELAKVMNENPQIQLIEIQGHTDSQGPDDFNKKLSDDRANSVMTHLVTIGQVDAKRLIAKGYGEDVPVGDNKTAKGRELNRRVEFMILKQTDAP